jgi:hypothetical protein
MPQTKKPTPLSTHALAAFLTWKQFDIIVLLRQEEVLSTGQLSDLLDEIVQYDITHGGAFYTGVTDGATYSSMRTLERRQLVVRHLDDTGLTQWSLTGRAGAALDWFEQTRLYAA